MQFGYSKIAIEKYKQLLRDSDVCIFFFYFEQMIKVYSVDPLNMTFEDFFNLLKEFEIFADEVEENIASELKDEVITLTSTSILHLWLQISNRIYKLTDPSLNLETIIEKKLDELVKWFDLEREFVNLVLPNDTVGEVIYREISYIQELFLFLRNGPYLEFNNLVAKMESYLAAIHCRIEQRVIKYQLILSMAERKTEFQPVQDEKSMIKVDQPELIEFMLRIAWLINKSFAADVTMEFMYGSNSEKKRQYGQSRAKTLNVEDIAEKFGTMIHGMRTFLLPQIEKLGLKEMHKGLYLCTLENITMSDSD